MLSLRLGGGMPESETEYFRRRATTERHLSLQAERTDVSAIHAELARLYQALVDEAELGSEAQIVMPVRLSA